MVVQAGGKNRTVAGTVRRRQGQAPPPMTNNSFTFHCDNGHGWLEVSQADLNRAGLTRLDFSGYSYANGDTLYLEEDCDAAIFLDAFSAKRGAPVLTENYIDGLSAIRDMSRLPHIADRDGF